MYIRPYDAVVWTSLSLAEATAETRTQYPILRGNEGASVASLSLNAAEETPVVEKAPTANNNTGLIALVVVLAAACVVLLVVVLKKKEPQVK